MYAQILGKNCVESMNFLNALQFIFNCFFKKNLLVSSDFWIDYTFFMISNYVGSYRFFYVLYDKQFSYT